MGSVSCHELFFSLYLDLFVANSAQLEACVGCTCHVIGVEVCSLLKRGRFKVTMLDGFAYYLFLRNLLLCIELLEV